MHGDCVESSLIWVPTVWNTNFKKLNAYYTTMIFYFLDADHMIDK